MPLYERVVDGKPAERVRTVANSYEDTRLGLAAQADDAAWRLVDESKPAAAEPDAKAKAKKG